MWRDFLVVVVVVVVVVIVVVVVAGVVVVVVGRSRSRSSSSTTITITTTTTATTTTTPPTTTIITTTTTSTSTVVVRREECVKSLAPELSKRRAVKIQKCQEQAISRDSGIIRQRCREFRNVKDKDSQEITQSTAVPARRSGRSSYI